MKYKFYCYDDYEGFQTFETLQDAEVEAERILDAYRQDHDGWNEDVVNLCYGSIDNITAECDVIEGDAEHEGSCDYKFYPVEV